LEINALSPTCLNLFYYVGRLCKITNGVTLHRRIIPVPYRAVESFFRFEPYIGWDNEVHSSLGALAYGFRKDHFAKYAAEAVMEDDFN